MATSTKHDELCFKRQLPETLGIALAIRVVKVFYQAAKGQN